MNFIFEILLNIVAWASAILFLIRGKRIIVETKSGVRWLIPIIFFLCGLAAFIRYRDSLSLFTFISLSICGGFYSIIPSGFAKDAFIVVGRVYPYNKCEDIKVVKDNAKVEVQFYYRHKAAFLFMGLEDERKAKDLVAQIRKEGKLSD